MALLVSGPAAFSRSGTVVIPSGSKSAVVPASGLSPSSLVLALMQNVAGGVAVKAAVPDPANSKFTVLLNKAPASPATATVAWFIVKWLRAPAACGLNAGGLLLGPKSTTQAWDGPKRYSDHGQS